MSDDAYNVQRCDFCKSGHVTGRNEGNQFPPADRCLLSFRNPLEVCDCCRAKHWNQDAEAIINEVVRRE
jgi:hypothetical protein